MRTNTLYDETPKAPRRLQQNGIFVKLAATSFCLALASSTSYWLSLFESRLAYRSGSPKDEAILYSFLYGLVLSQIIILFLPKASLQQIFSLRFVKIFLKSLILVAPIWLIIAWGGSELIHKLRVTGEKEWYEISLVLLSVSLTLLTWHYMYHQNNPFANFK